ncbi:MAG: PhnD/SsuA/transferrin family substrate-binding protein [Anaerolineales bacterium]|nr:PhnD/SsuA/transferrin family substrate-binding protein [Anaerolineales bacterium]MDW8447949.1 PhnD/SsuA/transferrin family substrate-binding protein [Anaerolineales bacterium]
MHQVLRYLLSPVLGLALLLAACAPAPTPTPQHRTPLAVEPSPTLILVIPTPVAPTPTPEPTATPGPQIGSTDRPIKLLFVPTDDVERLVAGGQLLAEVLHKATGLNFEVVVPTTEAVALEEMCASPDDTLGFLPAVGYVLVNQLCGVRVVAKAHRSGYDWQAAMIVVARTSQYQQLADLNGKKWAYPDAASPSAYLYPLYMFKEAGAVPGETLAAGSHDAVIRAVYNGEADFGTAFYNPPHVDGNPIEWTSGPGIDVPVDLLGLCAPTQDESALVCGNFEVRDARRNLRKELPDVVQKVRILATTPKIPNGAVSFGPTFPLDLMQRVAEALFAFAQNDPGGFARALEAHAWTSITPAADTEYAPIHLAIQASGLKIEDLNPHREQP